ncbi:hypothetical protein Anapl_18894 [Anas platyrhynchos]|uniref:Uncharacterized protein n=1 Tax=Anas platyrhynchos TaxID=8839 RepID=R0JAJ2_ANAPL|nr:hypothetical protein Anapl_18894 [Anas platyrhynchos]
MGLHAQLEPPCCSLSISRNSQAVQAALAPSPSPLMSRAAEERLYILFCQAKRLKDSSKFTLLLTAPVTTILREKKSWNIENQWKFSNKINSYYPKMLSKFNSSIMEQAIFNILDLMDAETLQASNTEQANKTCNQQARNTGLTVSESEGLDSVIDMIDLHVVKSHHGFHSSGANPTTRGSLEPSRCQISQGGCENASSSDVAQVAEIQEAWAEIKERSERFDCSRIIPGERRRAQKTA